MPKHSPAPWYQGRDINGMMIICQEYDGRCNYVDENPEYQSNCRLIDAAPDLLEALQQYGIGFSDEAAARAEFGDHEVDRELKRRAAIAKATGEQP